jgi:nucleoid-associated protein YgaU
MLSLGQVVWVPPARILERDYADLITGLQPLPADRSAPGVPTAVRPIVAAANAGPLLYKVRARGESLWEIARHTLNDSNQWAQILNLNRTLKPQPEIPLAPGTILRLPPEAKIDAADRP